MNLLQFFRRAPVVTPPPVTPPPWKKDQEQIFVAYPVGSKFEHCGRCLIVVRHRHGIQGFYSYSGIGLQTQFPEVVTHYADDHGEIHELAFGWDNFALLNVRRPKECPL